MKFSSSVLALALLQGSSAFMPQVPNTFKTSAPHALTYGNVEGQPQPQPNGNAKPAVAAGPKVADKVATQGPEKVSYATNSDKVAYSGPYNGPQRATPALNTPNPVTSDAPFAKTVTDKIPPVTVQGGSLRTYSFATPSVERAQLVLKTEGRPLNANIELWHGPDNTPQKMAIYSEDGDLRPFSVVVETPRSNNAVAIRNTGHLEFPLAAWVEPEDTADYRSANLGAITKALADNSMPKTIQGGALHTYPFDPSVSSVQVMLKTDGRPLNARIELMQGPNNNKQVMEIYTEDGLERPFFAVIETPGTGNVVRVVNTATVEFPMYACVEPYLVEQGSIESGGRGWDDGGTSSFGGPQREMW